MKLCLIVFAFWICSDSDNWVNDESDAKKYGAYALRIQGEDGAGAETGRSDEGTHVL